MISHGTQLCSTCRAQFTCTGISNSQKSETDFRRGYCPSGISKSCCMNLLRCFSSGLLHRDLFQKKKESIAVKLETGRQVIANLEPKDRSPRVLKLVEVVQALDTTLREFSTPENVQNNYTLFFLSPKKIQPDAKNTNPFFFLSLNSKNSTHSCRRSHGVHSLSVG